MKSPKKHRPPLSRGTLAKEIPAGIVLSEIAEQVRYVGSPEHKDTPSFAGSPRPRADATLCDRSLANQLLKITRWLQSAIRQRQVGEPWEGRFPRYVWHREGEVCYEARLTNRETGYYKGYPIEPTECPEGI